MHDNRKSRGVSILILSLVASAVLIFAFGTLRTTTSAAEPQNAASRSAALSGGQQSYADIVDHVAPAVVTIHAKRRVRAAQMPSFLDDPMFRQFFGNPNRGGGGSRGQSQTEHALGSGVILTADGRIITNHHVIDGAEEISVDLHDRRTFTAKVIGSDTPSDLAVLKIDATNLPVLAVADSDKVRVGDVCLAVGNPLGIGETVTMGIISAKGRTSEVNTGSFEDFLQTDAAINQGNSGGALVNTQGELIGINSQILSTSGGNIGIGFAIPSNMARNVMDQLTKNGKVSRGRLGVGIQDVTADEVKQFHLKEVRGILVNDVDADGPAAKAGIKEGDVILAVNGTRLDDVNSLRNHIAAMSPGTDVTITVSRDGNEQQVHARLTELTADAAAEKSPSGGSEGAGSGQLGVTVQSVTPEMISKLGLRRGTQGLVVTDVDPDSPAAEANIQADDVILEVNREPVKTPADLRAAVRKSGSGATLLLISREGRNAYVTVHVK